MTESKAEYLAIPKSEGPLPPDLSLAIMSVLSFHIGRRNPISEAQLYASLKDFKIGDGHMREQIKLLRRSGHLIGSVRGTAEHPERSGAPRSRQGRTQSKELENGGYYLITTAEELQEFLDREYEVKINDMRQTVEAMKKTASQRWGADSIQLKLL